MDLQDEEIYYGRAIAYDAIGRADLAKIDRDKYGEVDDFFDETES